MCSAFGLPLSPSAAMMGYRLMIQRVTKVAQGYPGFTELSPNTQATLLKNNADLLVSLRAAVFFDEKKKGLDQVCGVGLILGVLTSNQHQGCDEKLTAVMFKVWRGAARHEKALRQILRCMYQ